MLRSAIRSGGTSGLAPGRTAKQSGGSTGAEDSTRQTFLSYREGERLSNCDGNSQQTQQEETPRRVRQEDRESISPPISKVAIRLSNRRLSPSHHWPGGYRLHPYLDQGRCSDYPPKCPIDSKRRHGLRNRRDRPTRLRPRRRTSRHGRRPAGLEYNRACPSAPRSVA